MYVSQGAIVFLVLCAALLNGASGGSELSEYSYSTVRVTGSLKEVNGSWLIDGKMKVSSGDIALNGGSVEIVGLLYGASDDGIPVLRALQVRSIPEARFSIEKYRKPLEVKGKRATMIAQHPISGSNPRFDYFEGPLGQMVVYFSTGKDQNAFSLMSPSAVVTLVGTFHPVFAHSKRPGQGGEKSFYGFQMDVERIK